jgi:rare lipoprotein A
MLARGSIFMSAKIGADAAMAIPAAAADHPGVAKRRKIRIMPNMDRTKSPPIGCTASDAGYLRQNSENRNFVSSANPRLNYALTRRSAFDCGNIVVQPWLVPASAGRYLKLMDRRATCRASAILAGWLACAAVAPAAAAEVSDGAVFVNEKGSASWYAASHHSSRTASGVRYDQLAMTAAHSWLPFGTKVRVTRRDTGHSIVVIINDRLPSKRHIIDLSVGAAQQLGMLHAGTTQVDLTPA